MEEKCNSFFARQKHISIIIRFIRLSVEIREFSRKIWDLNHFEKTTDYGSNWELSTKNLQSKIFGLRLRDRRLLFRRKYLLLITLNTLN